MVYSPVAKRRASSASSKSSNSANSDQEAEEALKIAENRFLASSEEAKHEKTSNSGGNSPKADDPNSPKSPKYESPRRGSPRPGDLDHLVPNRPRRPSLQSLQSAPDVTCHQQWNRRRGRFVISPPHENPYMRWWDTLSGMCLIFVCFATPFEVAFLDISMQIESVFFWVNRLVDLFFFVDMILQFFVMQEVKHRYGVIYVFDHKAIIKRYVRGWFGVDLVSVIPFDLIGVLIASDDMVKLKLVRIIRLLKLFKLLRLLRGMRVLRRWESGLNVSYRRMTLMQLIIGVLFAAHWTSCVLGLMSTIQGTACTQEGLPSGCVVTWVTTSSPDEESVVSEWGMYLISLHTAVTILVHPHATEPTSDQERILFVVLVFIGGFIWTKVISRSTAISTSLDRHNIAYHQTMDDLNSISKDLSISGNLRRRLRQFFINTSNTSQRATWAQLMDRMSPQLRSEVTKELNKGWLRRVSYLAHCSRAMITDVAQHLNPLMFAQGESFGEPFTLYILNRGLTARGAGRILIRRPGSVWGEEHLLLTAWWLLNPTTSISLTFVEILSLSREAFAKVAEDHPENHPHLRKYYLKMVLRQGLLHEVKMQKEQSNQVAQVVNKEIEKTSLVRINDSLQKQLTQDTGKEYISTHTADENIDSVIGGLDARRRQYEAAVKRGTLKFGGQMQWRTIYSALPEHGVAAEPSQPDRAPSVVQASSPQDFQSSSPAAPETPEQQTQVLSAVESAAEDLFLWATIEERLEKQIQSLHESLEHRIAQQGEKLEQRLLNRLLTAKGRATGSCNAAELEAELQRRERTADKVPCMLESSS